MDRRIAVRDQSTVNIAVERNRFLGSFLRPCCTSLLLLAACLASLRSAQADLPSIRFDQLLPIGAGRGTELDVEIKGADIEGVNTLHFDHPGLSASPVPEKERWFHLKIDASVPVGTHEVYLSGRFGISNPRLFAVSQGLADVSDEEKNHSREEAQQVAVNSAINGIVNGNTEDFYRFTGSAQQRIWIDCQAQRLGSELDAVLALTTLDGQLLASSSDVYGRDPAIDFRLPSDGDYIIAVYDLSYRGGQPYRLVVTDQPQVETVFPAAVQVGHEATLTALGRNLQHVGGSASAWQEEGLPLDQVTFSFTPDPAVQEQGNYVFRDHPTHHSAQPTAATCTLTGQQVHVPGVESVWSFPPVFVSDNPVTVEVENNDTSETAQSVALPLTLAGRFDRPQDADWFEFQPPENGNYKVNVYCERIAGRADPYLVITDLDGKRVYELDDFGHRISAFDGHLRDPSQLVTLKSDQKYRMLVQDCYQRGGPRYHYVLDVRIAAPDFFPAVIHSSNQNPAGTTLFKGTAAYFDVIIHHNSNPQLEVTFTAEGLPPGLHMVPTTIPNDTRGILTLWADKDASDWTGPIQFVATAEVDGRTIRRVVRSHSRVSNQLGGSLVQRSPMIAIREQGPFDLRVEPAEITVEAGQTAEVELQLERLWPDFKDKVSIQPLNFPGNFKLGNFDIPSDKTTASMAIQVQDNTRPGRYTLSVLGQGQVPFDKDPKATERKPTLVSTPSRPVTIIVQPKPEQKQ